MSRPTWVCKIWINIVKPHILQDYYGWRFSLFPSKIHLSFSAFRQKEFERSCLLFSVGSFKKTLAFKHELYPLILIPWYVVYTMFCDIKRANLNIETLWFKTCRPLHIRKFLVRSPINCQVGLISWKTEIQNTTVIFNIDSHKHMSLLPSWFDNRSNKEKH